MIKIFLLSVTVLLLSGCFSKSDESTIKDSINAEYERLNSNDLERIFTAWTPQENQFTFVKYLICLENMNFNIKSVLNNKSKKDYKTILADTEKEEWEKVLMIFFEE